MSAAPPPSPVLRKRPAPFFEFLTSTIGRKFIVAITGLALVLFLIGHLAGNLTIFVGQDAINTYAVKLRELGPLLWVARIGLLAAVGLHIWGIISLWKSNASARPRPYEFKNRVQSSIFVRTMKPTGIVILAFVIYHLAQFTWQVTDPSVRLLHDAKGRHDVYSMVILSFQHPLVSVTYFVALALLAFHLSHGVASVFQTLGLSNRHTRPTYEKGALLFSWALFAGYATIPLASLLGIIKPILHG